MDAIHFQGGISVKRESYHRSFCVLIFHFPIVTFHLKSSNFLNFHTIMHTDDNISSKLVKIHHKFCTTHLKSSSLERTTYIPKSDSISSETNTWKCLLIAPLTFFTNFCKCHLPSDFHFVRHYLSSSKPHLLFLTWTQNTDVADKSHCLIFSNYLYPKFPSKVNYWHDCIYESIDISCSCADNHASSKFFIWW